jgi:hypothetical protein
MIPPTTNRLHTPALQTRRDPFFPAKNNANLVGPANDAFVKSPSVQFQGIHTNELAHSGFHMSTRQVKDSLKEDTDSYYYPEIPAPLQEAMSLNELLGTMDGIADELTSKKKLPTTLKYPMPNSTKQIELSFVKAGTHGSVYALNIPDCPTYAFKVTHAWTQDEAYREVGNHGYLRATDSWNTGRMYASNPGKRWSLMRFFNGTEAAEGSQPSKSKNKKGKKADWQTPQLRTFQENGIRSLDYEENPDDNMIGLYLADLGGQLIVPQGHEMTNDYFEQALKNRT